MSIYFEFNIPKTKLPPSYPRPPSNPILDALKKLHSTPVSVPQRPTESISSQSHHSIPTETGDPTIREVEIEDQPSTDAGFTTDDMTVTLVTGDFMDTQDTRDTTDIRDTRDTDIVMDTGDDERNVDESSEVSRYDALNELNVKTLRAMCKERSFKSTGNKAELIERLLDTRSVRDNSVRDTNKF